jgi:hypothetical protein
MDVSEIISRGSLTASCGHEQALLFLAGCICLFTGFRFETESTFLDDDALLRCGHIPTPSGGGP